MTKLYKIFSENYREYNLRKYELDLEIGPKDFHFPGKSSVSPKQDVSFILKIWARSLFDGKLTSI